MPLSVELELRRAARELEDGTVGRAGGQTDPAVTAPAPEDAAGELSLERVAASFELRGERVKGSFDNDCCCVGRMGEGVAQSLLAWSSSLKQTKRQATITNDRRQP